MMEMKDAGGRRAERSRERVRKERERRGKKSITELMLYHKANNAEPRLAHCRAHRNAPVHEIAFGERAAVHVPGTRNFLWNF